MDRRAFIDILAGALLAAPLAAEAQPAEKVPRMGFLSTGDRRGERLEEAPDRLRQAFLQGLRDHGYVEGRSVVIEYRFAERKPERLPALATELVALNVDVIVALSTIGAVAAKQATKTLPIVFLAGDPVSSGLVTSIAKPGGKVTGLSSSAAPDIAGKCLELLKQAVPGASRVAVLWQPSISVVGQRRNEDLLKSTVTESTCAR